MNSRRSFDHLVGAGEQRRGNFKTESLRGRNVNDEIELGRLLDRPYWRQAKLRRWLDRLVSKLPRSKSGERRISYPLLSR
jgi:hypothetical protein